MKRYLIRWLSSLGGECDAVKLSAAAAALKCFLTLVGGVSGTPDDSEGGLVRDFVESGSWLVVIRGKTKTLSKYRALRGWRVVSMCREKSYVEKQRKDPPSSMDLFLPRSAPSFALLRVGFKSLDTVYRKY